MPYHPPRAAAGYKRNGGGNKPDIVLTIREDGCGSIFNVPLLAHAVMLLNKSTRQRTTANMLSACSSVHRRSSLIFALWQRQAYSERG